MPSITKLCLATMSTLMIASPAFAQVSTFPTAEIPEPSTLAVFAVGIAGLALIVRRNRRK